MVIALVNSHDHLTRRRTMGSTDSFLSSVASRSTAAKTTSPADASTSAASKLWSSDTLPPLQTSRSSERSTIDGGERKPPSPISIKNREDADAATKSSSSSHSPSSPRRPSHAAPGEGERSSASGQHPTRFWGPVSGYSEGGSHARNRASTLSLPRPNLAHERMSAPRFSPTYPPGHPAATAHMAAGVRGPFASPYSAGSSGSSARDSITTLGSSLWDEQRSRRDSNVSTATSFGPERCSPAMSASQYPPHHSPYLHAPVSPYQLTAQLPRTAVQQPHLAPSGRMSHPSPPMSPIMMESLSVEDHGGPYHSHQQPPPPPPGGQDWEAHHGARAAAWHHPDSPYARGSPLLSSATGMPLPGFVGGGGRQPMRSPRGTVMELAHEEPSYFNYGPNGYSQYRGVPGAMPHSPGQWHSQVPPPMSASMGQHPQNSAFAQMQGGAAFSRSAGPDRLAHTRRRRRPPCSYASLITQAIQSSEDGRLTLREIYMWISQAYPGVYPLDGPDAQGWQNTVRHNLSLNKAFIKVARTAQEVCEGNKTGAANGASKGKGGWWTLDQDVMEVRRLQQEELLGQPAGSSSLAGQAPGSDVDSGEGSNGHEGSLSKKARSNGSVTDGSPEMGLGLVLDRPGSGGSDDRFGPPSANDDEERLPSVLRPSTAERRGSLGGDVGLLGAPVVPSSYPFTMQAPPNGSQTNLPRLVTGPGRSLAGRARGYTMSAADAALRGGSIASLPGSSGRRPLPPLQTSSTTRHVKSHTLTPTLSQMHLSPQKRKQADLIDERQDGGVAEATGVTGGHSRLRSVSSVELPRPSSSSSTPSRGSWSKTSGPAGLSSSPSRRSMGFALGLSGLSTLSGAATRGKEMSEEQEGDRMQVDGAEDDAERKHNRVHERSSGDEEMKEAAAARPAKSPRFASLKMEQDDGAEQEAASKQVQEQEGVPKTPSMSISGLLNG